MQTTSLRTNGKPTTQRRRMAQRAFFVLRVLLAIEFAVAGLMKVGGAHTMVKLFADIGAGQWFRYLVGVLEIAGAVGLLIPLAAGVAAAELTALMTGALVTRVAVLDGIPVIEAVFLIATAALAYERRAELRALTRRVLR
jgi:putative oxidoreductase